MTVNAATIPAELRELKQWILWRLVDIGAPKPTKIPYATTGHKASVTDPSTWTTFDNVFNSFNLGGYDGIGFVFSDNDPYSGIDLDDCSTMADGSPNPNYQRDMERQLKIYNEFNSYSERSPSGKGLHVLVKGKVASGRRRAFIELYSADRYFTMTGNVYNIKPIMERQELLNQLHDQMGGSPQTIGYTGDDRETQSDAEVIKQASNAANGYKFLQLYTGQWQSIYSSQSEADFALIDIIAFYTQNSNQIARIFRSCELGKRDKANRTDYVNGMIKRSFDRMLPPVDTEGFKIALEEKLKAKWEDLNARNTNSYIGSDNSNTSVVSNNANSDETQLSLGLSGPIATSITNTTTLPPGLMGEIAQFVYQASPRPVEEIALATAIALMAGICGRAYNVSGTGLNQYVMMIAATGMGKEAMATGIERLMNQVRMSVPVATEFLGPAEIASGQALYKYISKSPCFLSILGEIGIRIQQISSYQASSSEVTLRRMLLDLYNKSGQGQIARPSIFADSDKNTQAIASPSFSILGESTPERFYGALNEEMISEGLLPRFMIIEYTGIRVALNPSHLSVMPSMMLVDKMAQLCANAKTMMASQKVINVEATSEAAHMMNDFDKYSDAKINSTDKEVIRQLWNRAHIKVMKVAGLIAVGVNFFAPVILPEYVVWAMNMVQHDINALTLKFDEGKIGSTGSESKQLVELKKVIKFYVSNDYEKVKAYDPPQHLHSARIIPQAYLSRRLIAQAAFRHDRMGATNAIKRAVQLLIDTDLLREIARPDMIKKYNTTQKAYVLSNMALLDDSDDK